MKKTVFAVLSTTLLAGLMACSAMAQAQENKAVKPEVRPAPGMPGGPTAPAKYDRTESIARVLKLNDEQKGKVRPIFDDELKQRREVALDKTLTPEQRREKMNKITDDTVAKLKPILTDEQYKEYTTRMRGGVRPATPTVPGSAAPKAPAAPATPATPAPANPAK